MIEKCEEKFLSEIDIGTLIKRMRKSYNSRDDIVKDKKLRQYLKLNKSNIILSDDESQIEDHDFEVNKGYFSSSSDDNAGDVIQVSKMGELEKNLKERLRVNLIRNMPISNLQKMQLYYQNEFEANSKTSILGNFLQMAKKP